MAIGILWNLVTTAVELDYIYDAKLKLEYPKESKRAYNIYAWTTTAILTSIGIYFLVCGLSLWKHVTDEEQYEQDNRVFPFIDQDDADPRNFQDDVVRSVDNLENNPDGIL